MKVVLGEALSRAEHCQGQCLVTGTALSYWESAELPGQRWVTGTVLSYWDSAELLGQRWVIGTVLSYWDSAELLEQRWVTGTALSYWDSAELLGQRSVTGTVLSHWDSAQSLGQRSVTGTALSYYNVFFMTFAFYIWSFLRTILTCLTHGIKHLLWTFFQVDWCYSNNKLRTSFRISQKSANPVCFD